MNLVIIGAGGHGSEVHAYVLALQSKDSSLKLLGAVDDVRPPGVWETTRLLGGFEALRNMLLAQPREKFSYLTAVGHNETRRQLVTRVERLGCPNLEPWSLTHPEAFLGHDVVIGRGTLVAPRAVLTAHVRIGDHSIINVKASISHDCVIGNFTNINPGATLCGNVRVGDGAFVGAGATVIEKRSIGANAIIGAGAVVIDDIPPDVTAVGVPARVISRRGASPVSH